jgi:hypothetical protein
LKFIVMLTVFCTFSGVAIAQSPQCQSIARDSDRLACYDKAAPPAAMAKPAAPKAAAVAPKAPAAQAKPAASSAEQQGQVVDMLAAENSKLDARLKTICRGC